MSHRHLPACLLLTACAAVAQTRADSSPAPKLITLNLIATDSQGHPVPDLTADDLRVTDDGKPQSIAAFRKESHPPTTPTPNEFTNRPAALTNANVILFDLLNLPSADRRTSADQIARALQRLEAADSVYLYLLNVQGELLPVRALPNGSPLPPSTGSWTRDAAALIEKAMGPVAAVRPAFTTDVVLRIKTTYSALETLAGRLAPISLYKTITWITIGMPRSFPRENGEIFDGLPFLRQSANRIAQAGVGINPVSKLSASDAPENRETLQEFADLTGGKLYQGGDIERAIPDVIQSSRLTYRVQFAPRNWDGKFHKVRVTSTRKGIGLQCEQGYMAGKQPEQPREDPNIARFQSPFDASDIGLRATVSPGAQPHIVRLHLVIDPQDLQPGASVQLTFTVAGYLPGGRLQTYPPVPVNLNLTPEQREKASRDGLRLGHDVTVGDGVGKIRLLVEDRSSRNIGTLTIPIGN